MVGRILAINMITLLIPVIGFLYTDRYRQFLIDGELEALRSEGRIIAVALGSAAVTGVAPFAGSSKSMPCILPMPHSMPSIAARPSRPTRL